MSSTVKSKDKTSSAGQKFWHLKKLALGNKTNTNDQPLQRPPSPAESAFSIDTASLCDEDTPKPRSKRLSVLLSNRRQGNNGKVAPAKGLPSAMSVQNLHAFSSNNKTNSNMSTTTATTTTTVNAASNVRSVGGGGGVRQRTVSHTVGATAANDTRAAFLRSRTAEGAGGHGLTRHASVRDMKSRAVSGAGTGLRSASPPMCSKPNAPEEPVIDPATHPILTKKRSSLPIDSSNKPSSHLVDDRPPATRRTLRPASSFASLRARRSQQQLQQQQVDTPRPTDEWCHPNKTNNNPVLQSPPPTPTSPRLGRSNTVQNLSQPGSPRTPTRGSPPRTRSSLPPAFATAAVSSQNNNNTTNNQVKTHATDEELSSSTEELSWSRSSDEDGAVVVNNNKDEDGDSTDLSSDSDHNPKCSEAYWRSKLEKERAVVKALQRQKEACNKDIAFLSQSVDELTNEKQCLLTKYEAEKTSRERIQDNLSSVTDKLNITTEQVRQLVSEKEELEKLMKDQRSSHEKALTEQKANLEKEKCSETLSNEKLQAQLRHSQDQVKVLKATMEQFLRMGIFSEDMSIYGDIASKFSTTNKASAIESLAQQDTKQQHAVSSTKPEEITTQVQSIALNKNTNAAKQDTTMPEIKSVADLDNHLRELLREKELLQSEYSKIPITGVNALTRRRKEELEARLDQVDSQMSKIKLKHRDLLKK